MQSGNGGDTLTTAFDNSLNVCNHSLFLITINALFINLHVC